MSTTAPQRSFSIDLTPDAVTFAPATETGAADIDLPAEAFIRLVYGRLDPEHTPRGHDAPALATLRRVFPGP